MIRKNGGAPPLVQVICVGTHSIGGGVGVLIMNGAEPCATAELATARATKTAAAFFMVIKRKRDGGQ